MRMTSCPLPHLISPRAVENLNRNASSQNWMDSEEVFETAPLFIFSAQCQGSKSCKNFSQSLPAEARDSRCTSAQNAGPQPKTSKQQPI